MFAKLEGPSDLTQQLVRKRLNIFVCLEPL